MTTVLSHDLVADARWTDEVDGHLHCVAVVQETPDVIRHSSAHP